MKAAEMESILAGLGLLDGTDRVDHESHVLWDLPVPEGADYRFWCLLHEVLFWHFDIEVEESGKWRTIHGHACSRVGGFQVPNRDRGRSTYECPSLLPTDP